MYDDIAFITKANVITIKDPKKDTEKTVQLEITPLSVTWDQKNSIVYYSSTVTKWHSLNYETNEKKDLAYPVLRVMSDGRIFSTNASKLYGFYDPATDKFESLSDYSGGLIIKADMIARDYTIAIDNNRSYSLIHARAGMKDVAKPASANLFLLTFDGGQSFSTYRSGRWETVLKGKYPETADLETYGMSSEFVNNLKSADFAKLYAGGRHIYSVGFAALLQTGVGVIPSLNSFQVILTRKNPLTAQTTSAVYAAKSQSFDGASMRAVSKVYPIEYGAKPFEYVYLFQKGASYYVIKDGTWKTVTATGLDNIAALGQDTWVSIKQQSMSTEELRAAPESVLTANLAGQAFSVICVMKVYDTSTEGYRSVIQIDYAQKRFVSGTLTMTIGYTDGTKETVPGLTATQIEDFMEWLYRRQNGLGPVFYTIKVGANNYFINYYAIATVNVVES